MVWWFDRNPERLEFELAKLDEAGFAYSVTDDGGVSGVYKLEIQYHDREDPEEPGRAYTLKVLFPIDYPDFPFEIYVPNGQGFPPGPHLNPHGPLCLLQDAGNSWDGSRDYLAAFLLCRVNNILRAHRGDKTVVEAQEGLRQTEYFPYAAGAAILVGDWAVPPGIDGGTFLWRRFPMDPVNRSVRGAITHLKATNGALLGELSLGQFWDDLIRGAPELSGQWVRLKPIPEGSNILEAAGAALKDIAIGMGGHELIALLIPEEREKGGAQLDNWVFFRRTVQLATTNQQLTIIGPPIPIRAEQVSQETKWARAPRATPIGTKKALLVGLGAVGGPLAWQLARAGIGDLRCADYDSVQIGNIPRWLYGMPMIGESKAACVALNLQYQYPPLRAEPIFYKVGASNTDPQVHGRFMAALEEADIVVDATAELSVNRYMAKLAKEKGIPYVWAYGSPGGWGGVIGRIVPGRTPGCYECFRYKLSDAAEAQTAGYPLPAGAIALPPEENRPNVQPVGCFHPTFRGTGFDMDQVSQMAARLVVATLCLGADPQLESYPDFPWDVAILSQWDPSTDLPTVPTWTTYSLDRHQKCQYHDD